MKALLNCVLLSAGFLFAGAPSFSIVYPKIANSLYSDAHLFKSVWYLGVPGGSDAYFQSSDGLSWIPVAHDSVGVGIRMLAAGTSALVAVTNDMKILNTSDGVNWTQTDTVKTSLGTNIKVFACGDHYLLSNPDGIFASSSDGVHWAAQSAGINTDAIACRADTLIALSNYKVSRSLDGGLSFDVSKSLSNLEANAVAYGNGSFVIAGNCTILRSQDGATWDTVAWSHQSKANTTCSQTSSPVVYLNGNFYVDYRFGDADTVFASSDGLSWHPWVVPPALKLGSYNKPNLVVLNGGLFTQGNDQSFYWTADGSSWKRLALDSTVNIDAAVGSDSLVIATDGAHRYKVHSDGSVEIVHTISYVQTLGRAGVGYVQLEGTLTTSQDGSVWSPTSLGSLFIAKLWCNDSLCVAADQNGKNYSTTDGANWAADPGLLPDVMGGAVRLSFYKSDLFTYDTGAAYNVFRQDGSGSVQKICLACSISALATTSSFNIGLWGWNGNQFVLIDQEHSPKQIATSTDGVTWSVIEDTIVNGPAKIQTLFWDGSEWCALENSGLFWCADQHWKWSMRHMPVFGGAPLASPQLVKMGIHWVWLGNQIAMSSYTGNEGVLASDWTSLSLIPLSIHRFLLPKVQPSLSVKWFSANGAQALLGRAAQDSKMFQGF